MKSMKKNKNLNIAIVIILGILLIFVNKSVCMAASAKITLSTKETHFEIGKTFTVEIKVNSKESVGDFEGYLTYDANILEFENEASFIAGGDGLIKISDINVVNGENSKKYIVKFRTKETGSTKISFRETPSAYDFDTGNSMSVSSNAIEIKVHAKALASDNGDLKELKVKPGTLKPEFSPEITDYSIDVKNDIEQMIISSIPSDEKASVSIDGNKDLVSGENKIDITVKAESGDKKIYKVTVVKEEKDKESEPINTDNDPNNNEDGSGEYTNNEKKVELSKPEIINDNGKIFFQNGYKYQILTPGNTVEIPKGYEKTSLTIDNTSIEGYRLESDPNNEFLLIFAKGPSGKEGFYQYDKVENTLQRYSNSRPNNIVEKDNAGDSKLVIMSVILVVLTAACIILTLSLLQSNTHNKRRKKK